MSNDCQSLPPRRRTTTRPPVRRPRPLQTVLVVDDDPAVCRVIGKLLHRQGFTVMYAHCAAEALTVLDRASHVDLVLTDQIMPGMTGVELLDRVHLRWPAMPGVIMSGLTSVPPPGILQTLRKPFSANELSHCVSEVLSPRPR